MTETPIPQNEAAADTAEAVPDNAPDASSLRGTMTAVLLMAAFFVLTWGGVLLLHVARR